MVDLDSVDTTKPPPAAAVHQTTQQLSNNRSTQICRLCLQHDQEVTTNKIVDIYEEPGVDEKGNRIKAVEELLYELFQIKYDKTCLDLPHIICTCCWDMVQAFNNFRSVVQKCEELLQKRLKLLQTNAFLSEHEDKRPGLNGNPGEFIPDEYCEIEEVNPEQDFESSEDDFSMESDSEPDEIEVPVKGNEVMVPNTKPTKTTAKKSSAADATSDTTVSNDLNVAKDMATTSTNILLEHMNLEFTIKNTYSCQYCDMAFTTQADCTDHESRHDPVSPYICNFCPFRCINRQNLIGHIKEAHDPERPYVCALCNKGFCRRSDLKKHSIVHTGVRPFACPLCSKSFSRNTNLTKHIRIHTSVKPYVCKQCPRSFTTGPELLRHSRTHSEVRAFKCSRCPATYARKDKLQLHEQSHYRKESEFLLNQSKQPGQQNITVPLQTPEIMENMIVPINPYANADIQQLRSSDELQKSLFSSNQMPQKVTAPPPPPAKPTTKSHGRIHTCDICAKSFTRERDLHRHQALHLDTLFTCKQCGLGFSRREKLARHELEHHAPQYPCDICRITFHKRDELEMHLKMHELQQNAALSAHQAVLNAAGVVHTPLELTQIHHLPIAQSLQQPQPPPLAPVVSMTVQRPSAADMSFYSNMVPTMNLGFYSETRPEDRNGI